MSEFTYHIRLADLGDIAALPAIERAAAQRFVDVGYIDLAEGPVTDLSTLIAAQREERLWVVVARAAGTKPAARRAWAQGEDPEEIPVGFALVIHVDEAPHIQEMDVLPDHGRRGLGRSIVRKVIEHCRAAGHEKLTLTTLKNVPWNGPFYNSLGFREIPLSRCGAELQALFEKEIPPGVPAEDRVIMIQDLG